MFDLTDSMEKKPRKFLAGRFLLPRLEMTLGFRLNLAITLLLLLILVTGAAFVIINARQDVAKETRASVSLVLQLLNVAESITGSKDSKQLWKQLVRHIDQLETIRHLDIVIRDHSGDVVATTASDPGSQVADAPTWFIRLVTPKPVEYRRDLGSESSGREIIIRSNPAGEITEAWNDARPLLILQFLFALLVEALVFLTVGRVRKPLGKVLAALEDVEQGQFQTRLPHFRLPETARISIKFNQMAQALEQERLTSQRLARRALSIQEQERRFMARELHDELGQSISAIKALGATIRRQADDDPQRVGANAASIIEIADQTYGVIRTMVYQLRPPALDELGLVIALERMVDSWNSRHASTFCSLQIAPTITRLHLNGDIGIHLYRIVQESLTNIAKHACANRAYIHLRSACNIGNQLLLDIGDDGIGLSSKNRSWGVGLRGIHDRVAALDGYIEVFNEETGGMLLHIVVPLGAGESAT